jgi:heme-degrading monooxygenase HmoA
MVIEHALLQIRTGQETAFESAMAQARPLIVASPGFAGIEVRPAMEKHGLYLLLVRWQSIANHRDDFRQSERYAHWKALFHPFYDPMPVVDYFGESL